MKRIFLVLIAGAVWQLCGASPSPEPVPQGTLLGASPAMPEWAGPWGDHH